MIKPINNVRWTSKIDWMKSKECSDMPLISAQEFKEFHFPYGTCLSHENRAGQFAEKKFEKQPTLMIFLPWWFWGKKNCGGGTNLQHGLPSAQLPQCHVIINTMSWVMEEKFLFFILKLCPTLPLTHTGTLPPFFFLLLLLNRIYILKIIMKHVDYFVIFLKYSPCWFCDFFFVWTNVTANIF